MLIRELAVADVTSNQLDVGVDVLIQDGYIAWMGPTDTADARAIPLVGRPPAVPFRPQPRLDLPGHCLANATHLGLDPSDGIPVGRVLVRIGHAQQQRVVEKAADQLHADW